MSTLYAISGVTGMTGNELVRQILAGREGSDHILGFDNFFASSIETVKDCLGDGRFEFFEYDLNNKVQMEDFEQRVAAQKQRYDEVIYINCAAVVHTEHFYHVYDTFETNVTGMNEFLQQAVQPEDQLCSGEASYGIFYERCCGYRENQRLFNQVCQCIQQE